MGTYLILKLRMSGIQYKEYINPNPNLPGVSQGTMCNTPDKSYSEAQHTGLVVQMTSHRQDPVIVYHPELSTGTIKGSESFESKTNSCMRQSV